MGERPRESERPGAPVSAGRGVSYSARASQHGQRCLNKGDVSQAVLQQHLSVLRFSPGTGGRGVTTPRTSWGDGVADGGAHDDAIEEAGVCAGRRDVKILVGTERAWPRAEGEGGGPKDQLGQLHGCRV